MYFMFVLIFNLALRPCVRQNFPNFLFSRVLKMFGCQSSEKFWKNWNFWTRKIFAKKFGKSLEKSSDINQNCTSILKILKKLWKFEFLSQKTLFLGQKVWKNSETGFPNIRKFWKLFYSKISENYEKMMLNSNFGNREKLVPTQKLTQKFGMQGLT